MYFREQAAIEMTQIKFVSSAFCEYFATFSSASSFQIIFNAIVIEGWFLKMTDVLHRFGWIGWKLMCWITNRETEKIAKHFLPMSLKLNSSWCDSYKWIQNGGDVYLVYYKYSVHILLWEIYIYNVRCLC